MSYADEATSRLRSDDFERWMDQARSTGFCSNPVKLVGHSDTYDAATGELLHRYSSSTEPDGVTYVRCGNRRAARCPSCSHEYKSDMWHLIVAGAAGGSKGIPEHVGTHPLVFVTLTAPSFGAVHSSGMRDGRARVCRPRANKTLCPHGRPTWCMRRHEPGASAVGEPLCGECYDYDSHVVWQWYSPELWRRFVIRLRREIAHTLGTSESAMRERVRVQFAKVAEFQRRGVVHFHALIRLDGKPTEENEFPPPAVNMSAGELAALARVAASRTTVVSEPLPGDDVRRELAWGVQCDARVVARGVEGDGQLSDRAVAAYIAKYATKATEDLIQFEGRGAHVAALRDTVAALGSLAAYDETSPYHLLSRWESMLGFRGHFSTKSRRYSTTLGQLRNARRQWNRRNTARNDRTTQVADFVDDDDSTLIIGSWSFAGMGWLTKGDAALAEQAAAAAREWRDSRRTAKTRDHETR